MQDKKTQPGGGLRRLAATALLAGTTLLTGCASVYVDTATKEVPVSEMKKVAQPKPVQLAFEFQNNGAPNASATKLLKDAVAEQIKSSGLFSAIDAAPGSDAAMLNVTLNNIPLTKDAAKKGFITGLTFGAAGTAVTDGFICTLRYLPPGQSEFIVVSAKHAIHTTLGNASPPPGAGKSTDMKTAVFTMTHEVLSNTLRDLATTPTFN